MDSAKNPSTTTNNPAVPATVSLGVIFKIFLTAGAISFGGGVVAYLREYIVRSQRWLDDDDFLDALEVSETLPGLNSVNMSVIVGDRLHGALGAATAVMGLILPGATVMMTLGVLWEQQRHNPYIKAFLLGIAASAVGLLLTVTLQLGHKQFVHLHDLIFILATFIAVSYFHFSLITVLLTIGTIAVVSYRPGVHPAETERFAHLRRRFHSHRAHWRH